jgi:hypothetical protein
VASVHQGCQVALLADSTWGVRASPGAAPGAASGARPGAAPSGAAALQHGQAKDGRVAQEMML